MASLQSASGITPVHEMSDMSKELISFMKTEFDQLDQERFHDSIGTWQQRSFKNLKSLKLVLTSYSSSRKIVEQLQVELRDVLNSESNGADQSDDEQLNTRWSKTGSPIELNLSSNNIKELSTDDAKAFERLLENAQAWFKLFPVYFRSGISALKAKDCSLR